MSNTNAEYDAIQEALQRAKQLASTTTTATNGQKRSHPEEFDSSVENKRFNNGMAHLGGMGMGGPIGDTLVETIEVPDNAVGLVIGRGGEQIGQIQTHSGCRVQMAGESLGNGMRQCTLQGPKHCIDKARQMIEEVINRSRTGGAGNGGGAGSGVSLMGGGGGHQNGGGNGMGGGQYITQELLIPGPKCGLIIGKNGETIKSLQEQIGVKMLLIQDTQAVSMGPKPLRITGFADKVEAAKRAVEQLLNNEEMRGGPKSVGEVIVPRSSVGIIIGKGGETIKRLAMESGAKIQFKPDDDPSIPERCAVIQGTPEQINRATQLISDLVQRSASGGGGGGAGGGGGLGGNQEVFYMHVPANKTGLVIGKGGDTIKQICGESGAHVELSREPPPNAQEKVFVIKGSPYQIHHAQHIIRIKVGDIAPGTPVPPFHGSSSGQQMTANNPYGVTAHPTQFGGGAGADQFGTAQWTSNGFAGGQDASVWAQYYNQQQQGNYAAAATQPGFAGAGGQYQAVAQGLQQQQQPQQQTAAAAGGTPAMNPQTGQPDYSAQWAEYYRSLGMHEQAKQIEMQMQQQRGSGGGGGNPAPAGQQQYYNH